MNYSRNIKTIFRSIFEQSSSFFIKSKLGLCNNVSDEEYLRQIYRFRMGRDLNLDNPKTLNEKLQWLKLHNRKPEYTTMVDKYEVKKYVAKLIGEEYIIPTLGVWNNVEDIELDKLPNQFVLKCTHDSGSIVICKDKSKLDFEAAKKKLKKGLKRNLFWYGREWPYKNVKRRIIAEKYMTDSPDIDEFTDYKFYCFNGYVDCVLTCIERSTGNPKFYFFDKDWKLLRYNKRGKEAPADFTLPKPENIEEMFRIASELSKGIPFLRVDLYNSSGKIYFGELTFFPDSGWDPNRLPEIDLYFGDLVDLERVNNGNK